MSAEIKTTVEWVSEEIKKNPWLEYERLKTELPHDLTEEEYERALRQILDELGI